jgi:hypothetical protein
MSETDGPRTRKLLNAKSVSARYDDLPARTLNKWIGRGWLPKPTVIGNRRFWDEYELNKFEASRDAAK